MALTTSLEQVSAASDNMKDMHRVTRNEVVSNNHASLARHRTFSFEKIHRGQPSGTKARNVPYLLATP